jgi:hypothetical protein
MNARFDILLPLLVQVGLTFVLMYAMAFARVGSLRRRELKVSDIALRQPKWPQRPTQIANAFHNQLETPLLFYVLVVLLIVTGTSNAVFVTLAWVWVALRVVHALIHVTGNDVQQRFYAFAAGTLVLLAMWVLFAVRILSGPAGA